MIHTASKMYLKDHVRIDRRGASQCPRVGDRVRVRVPAGRAGRWTTRTIAVLLSDFGEFPCFAVLKAVPRG